MCLYPKLIRNKKYTANKKNGGVIPAVLDKRTLYVPIGCQNCIECRKQKAREWQARLLEDIKENKNGKFITLTFTDESILKLSKEFTLEGYELDNEIATRAVRLFLERWRKKFKKSLRHWLVTELGHNGTENIHLHGIVWTDKDIENVVDIWQYGYVWTGKKSDGKYENYVNEKTVNYIIKYVTKQDEKHQGYKSRILTSAGIGANYTKTGNYKNNIYKGENTNESYKTNSGHKMNMPIYWRNKIYTDEEKEQLWIQKLDKEERWVLGNRIDISEGDELYKMAIKTAREKNKRLGYGGSKVDADLKQYELDRRKLMHETRIKKAIEKLKGSASGGVLAQDIYKTQNDEDKSRRGAE